MRRRLLVIGCSLLVVAGSITVFAQQGGLQPAPVVTRVEPPPPTATPHELEQRGDELRQQKMFLDAIDYYRAALKKRSSAVLHNKIGIAQLQMMRLKDARKSFGKAIKMDKNYAEAYNNLGVTWYQSKKFGKAIKEYKKALAIREESPSFHSNLGSAYFSDKKFQLAAIEYARALQLDPDIFERNSKGGVAAQLQSPEDRAHFSYVIAKMYAQVGNFDRSLQYLRRAIEDGYKVSEQVFKDQEFAKLREDPRFTELMAANTVAIPQ
ncbi:MAG TPA: tetratricopeptide repeat protein [Terriglobales bacterium]|nr:tetratricopeptide repeat protein [Terriglobales bacterium]